MGCNVGVATHGGGKMDVRARAFNEWMRRYTEEPERYEREMVTVRIFLSQRADGREPEYGERCAEYLRKLETELSHYPPPQPR